jgi:AcrR family transcriptional regulator
MDAVVRRAGLSKGAVLHHFKTKDELANRLLLDGLQAFDAHVAALRGDDRSPGSYTRAYIRVALEQDAAAKCSPALRAIGQLAHDSSAGRLLRESVRGWSESIENDGLGPLHAQLVRLAADGLWWNESSGAAPLTCEIRAQLAALLLSMTR